MAAHCWTAVPASMSAVTNNLVTHSSHYCLVLHQWGTQSGTHSQTTFHTTAVDCECKRYGRIVGSASDKAMYVTPHTHTHTHTHTQHTPHTHAQHTHTRTPHLVLMDGGHPLNSPPLMQLHDNGMLLWLQPPLLGSTFGLDGEDQSILSLHTHNTYTHAHTNTRARAHTRTHTHNSVLMDPVSWMTGMYNESSPLGAFT